MKINHGLVILLAALLSPHAMAQSSTPRVNGQRLVQHLQELAEFGKNPQGGVSRVAYTDADLKGREYVMQLMREAKMQVSVDLAGNIVGSRSGSDAALLPILLGSHIDSVPEGGNYDGDVGSLGAIEVAQTLTENSVTLRHPLQVIIFQNEEGGTVGSQAISSGLDERILNLVSQSRKSIREGTKLVGGDPGRLAEGKRKPGSIAGYFELHIEQGGTLEREKIAIGVVEGIVGILHSDVTVEGFANHAGTTPMDQRHDALLAASKLIQAVNQVVTSIAGRQVGTVGKIQVSPGAYNVIPGKAVFGLELRDLDSTKVRTMFERIQAEAQKIAQTSGTKISFTEPVVSKPALTDPRFQRLIDSAAHELGFGTKLMPSGAGHDAQEIANIGPVGMIFIPSVGGISHSPREFSRPEDIENGANVLLHALLRLDALTSTTQECCNDVWPVAFRTSISAEPTLRVAVRTE
jgi:beta-ureidopropionase / N-carbamoyl-L-amino-acid hydrolase